MSSAAHPAPHYTVADYQLWEGEWELWDGVAVSMTPSPFGRHSSLSVKLASIFLLAVETAECDATVLAEIDWIVSDDTVLRPDISVSCGPPPERHLEESPAIVVEILSQSTRQRDLGYKRDRYRGQGVPYYLIVDPEASTLTALKLDASGQYESVSFDDTLAIQICDTCELAINIGKLFDR